MPAFLKKRLGLFLVLIVFIILKFPHLFYAFYWDESWPYAAAVNGMYHHGPSLLPGALDPELSRGHPLFFHFSAALWMNIFGRSDLAIHSFSLFVSVLFLITIYEAGISLFNQRVALISILFTVTLEVFFVQSSFLLPEILVAFLTFAGLYFYVKEKYFLTALVLTMLFYTKESGLVIGVVLGADAMLSLFNNSSSLKIRCQRLVSISVPFFLVAVFFLVQKHTRGWYLFPMHLKSVEHTWDAFWFNFRNNCLGDAFRDYLGYGRFVLLLVLALVAAIKNKDVKYLAVFLPALFIYCLVDDHKLSKILPGIPFFILFLCSVILFVHSLFKLNFFIGEKQKKFVMLTCVFICCYLCFSSVVFFTYRYMISGLIPLFFFTAVVIDKMIERSYSLLYYPVLVTILILGFLAFYIDNNAGDTDVRAFHALDVQQREIDYLEQNNAYDKVIGCGGFLGRIHLSNPATGFLKSDKYFKKVDWSVDGNCDFIVFDSIEPDDRLDNVKKSPAFHLAFRYENDHMWTEIYAKN